MNRKHFGLAALALVLAAGALVWGLSSRHKAREIQARTSLKDIFQWTGQADKEAAARYLNHSVDYKNFHASVHIIQKGDTFWNLAQKYGVNIDTVVGFNAGLTGFFAPQGSPLLMSNCRGMLHQVAVDETLDTLAARYGVSPTALAQWNTLPGGRVSPGEVLFIPKARPDELTKPMKHLYWMRGLFSAPLEGRYSSLEGYRTDPFNGEKRFHNGVDIAAPFNSRIHAAAPGKVILAGWNDGFGKCVILSNPYGYHTLYGHMNMILVKAGQRVYRGQVIGRVGMTGMTTGPHLHFTIYYHWKVQNPLQYLW